MNLAIRHTLEIEGWDAVTYKKLADTFDTRKSSIQKYFPSQQHFLLALDGYIYTTLNSSLIWTDINSFELSWQKNMSEKGSPFYSVIEMIIIESTKKSTSTVVNKEMKKIRSKCQGHFKDAFIIEKLLGETVLTFFTRKSHSIDFTSSQALLMLLR